MKTWESFCDDCYWHMWAVRPEGDKDFNSQELFHVSNEKEATHLMNYLNEMEKKCQISST